MELKTEQVNGVSVVTVPCDTLDASNAGEFKTAAEPLIEDRAKIVFDLSRLQFVDSSGCGALLSCLRKVTGSGGDMKLCGVQKPVRVLFELVRMHRIMDVYNTRDEALAAYA